MRGSKLLPSDHVVGGGGGDGDDAELRARQVELDHDPAENRQGGDREGGRNEQRRVDARLRRGYG
jgi:hypothetical protein